MYALELKNIEYFYHAELMNEESGHSTEIIRNVYILNDTLHQFWQLPSVQIRTKPTRIFSVEDYMDKAISFEFIVDLAISDKNGYTSFHSSCIKIKM